MCRKLNCTIFVPICNRKRPPLAKLGKNKAFAFARLKRAFRISSNGERKRCCIDQTRLCALLATALIATAANAAAQTTPSGETLLLRQPTISRDHLAFVYAGDIWLADRNGKNPARLTTHPADEFAPSFSPDGKWIAFSARYDGNTDVYVLPVTGGQPKRLTWHPGTDTVNGWSRDGKRVVFASPREIALGRSNQLYEVPVDGGFEKKIMDAQAFEGAWSPDGKRLAYRPYRMSHAGGAGWRQNRGGSTPPIWILDPAANTWEKIPHVNASDSNPLWIGNDIVFISDRNDGAANLFHYNGQTKALRQLTKETVWDVRQRHRLRQHGGVRNRQES